MSTDGQYLVHIQLDEKVKVRRQPETESERRTAIHDLLEENCFTPLGYDSGPYILHISIPTPMRLIFDIRTQHGMPLVQVPLSLSPLKNIIKDYLLTCESYYDSIKTMPLSRIEAIDMARRGLHNEGSSLLHKSLAEFIHMDKDTARRLFTLICILHIRG